VDIVKDHETNLPTTKNPRVEPRQCMEALDQPNLERDVEELGDEDLHLVTIVKCFRNAMGIYNFQMTAE
jgi:hypothetical protein